MLENIRERARQKLTSSLIKHNECKPLAVAKQLLNAEQLLSMHWSGVRTRVTRMIDGVGWVSVRPSTAVSGPVPALGGQSKNICSWTIEGKNKFSGLTTLRRYTRVKEESAGDGAGRKSTSKRGRGEGEEDKRRNAERSGQADLGGGLGVGRHSSSSSSRC